MNDTVTSEKSPEERIIEVLKELKEGCHFNITEALYPGLIEHYEEFRAKMDETAAVLKSMEFHGLVESAGEFAGVEFFKIKAEGENSPERTQTAGKVIEDVENTVLTILKPGKMTAADVAERLFPRDDRFRARTSQIFVCLKRLEKKGKVAKAEKEGKKQYYMLAEQPAPKMTEEAEEFKAKPEGILDALDEDIPSLEAETMEAEIKVAKKAAGNYGAAAMGIVLIAVFGFLLFLGRNNLGFLAAPGADGVPLTAAAAALLALGAAFFLLRRKNKRIKALKTIEAHD